MTASTLTYLLTWPPEGNSLEERAIDVLCREKRRLATLRQAGIVITAMLIGIPSSHAAALPLSRDLWLAQARAQHDQGRRMESLRACEELLQRWPNDAGALALRVQLLSEMGAAGLALDLAHILPLPLRKEEVAQLEADAAAHRTRWSEAMPADTRRPYTEADQAVAVEDSALAQYRQIQPEAPSAVLADRTIALGHAWLSQQAVNEYDSIYARGVPFPSYASVAAAYALLRQRQPERAIPLFEEAIRTNPGPYPQEQVDPRIGLAYAYLEVGRYRDAKKLTDHVAEQEEAWLNQHGTVVKQSNSHKADAAVAAAQLRLQAWLYHDAWIRLEALRAEAPASAAIWQELAAVERARGWPRRSEDTLMGAISLDPDSTAARLGAIEDWREMYDFARVESTLHEVEAVVPRDPDVQLARQSWDRQRGWQFDLSHTDGRGGSANFGDADHETETTLQSPLMADHWRFYGIARYATARIPEGGVTRESLGLGFRGYARGLEAYVQALPSLDKQSHRTAVEAGLRWLPTDRWTYALDWSTTGDLEVPLRAHYYGVTAHAVSGSAQWRASEQSTIKVDANNARFSDGNRRYGWNAAWNQRVHTAPWLSIDAGLEAGATHNSRTDVPYYSPSCAHWVAATGRLESGFYQRYERTWQQRVDLSMGSYDECRYGSGLMASARYGQSYAPRGGLSFDVGIGWATQPYDGRQDNRVILDITIHWGE